MPTDPMPTDPRGARAERQWRRYRRTTVATIAALAVAAAGLGVAAVLRGPTLDSASVNTSAVIARDGQKLVLHADQPLDAIAPEQIHITPSTDVAVTAAGNDVTIAFERLLDYGTEYSVLVDDVVGSSTGLTGSLEYRFETPDVPVHTLLRQGGAGERAAGQPEDQVLRSTLAGGTDARSEVVFESPHISEYAVTDVGLAAIVADDAGTTTLEVVPDGGSRATVPTPAGSRLQNLRASSTARLFGFSVNGGADPSGREYQSAVFVFDPLSSSGRAEEVTGFDGAPLPLVDWRFVPGTSSIVGQGVDEQLYLIDALGGSDPAPLGRHVELRDFLPGGLQLVVADVEGASTIDLATGDVTALPELEATIDPAAYPKKVVSLNEGVALRQYDDVDYSQANPFVGSVIVEIDETGTRELYRPPTEGSRVRDYCVSPNGQYLAVEVVPAGAIPDGYAVSAYAGMTTYFVDVDTGESNRGVPGFLPDWCS
jgi:hypothetical protein